MICKNCGKTISESDKFCEYCGKELSMEQSSEESNLTNEEFLKVSLLVSEAKRAANKLILRGIGWILAGVIITLITYSMAEPGGTYYVFWGLSIYGIYQLIKGIYYSLKPNELIKKILTESELKGDKNNNSK